MEFRALSDDFLGCGQFVYSLKNIITCLLVVQVMRQWHYLFFRNGHDHVKWRWGVLNFLCKEIGMEKVKNALEVVERWYEWRHMSPIRGLNSSWECLFPCCWNCKKSVSTPIFQKHDRIMPRKKMSVACVWKWHQC